MITPKAYFSLFHWQCSQAIVCVAGPYGTYRGEAASYSLERQKWKKLVSHEEGGRWMSGCLVSPSSVFIFGKHFQHMKPHFEVMDLLKPERYWTSVQIREFDFERVDLRSAFYLGHTQSILVYGTQNQSISVEFGIGKRQKILFRRHQIKRGVQFGQWHFSVPKLYRGRVFVFERDQLEHLICYDPAQQTWISKSNLKRTCFIF